MRRLQIRDKRKTRIPGSFKHKSALCILNFFLFLGWFLFIRFCIWGGASSQQKPNDQPCWALCFALVWFSFPPPKELAYCKANGCGLTNSKQNPQMETKPRPVQQQQRSVLLRGVTAIIRGARAVLAGSSLGRFVSPLSFVQDLPNYMSPANQQCVLFSVLHGSQGQREELNPTPSRAARPQWWRIRHGGANVPNKTITAGSVGSLFSDEAHLGTSPPEQSLLRL